MKRASVRDLRYDFRKVEKMLREGEVVEITKMKKVVGRLVPEDAPLEASQMPDFLARMNKIFGEKKLLVSWVDFLAERKGRY